MLAGWLLRWLASQLAVDVQHHTALHRTHALRPLPPVSSVHARMLAYGIVRNQQTKTKKAESRTYYTTTTYTMLLSARHAHLQYLVHCTAQHNTTWISFVRDTITIRCDARLRL